jgi:hypothetical protein
MGPLYVHIKILFSLDADLTHKHQSTSPSEQRTGLGSPANLIHITTAISITPRAVPYA